MTVITQRVFKISDESNPVSFCCNHFRVWLSFVERVNVSVDENKIDIPGARCPGEKANKKKKESDIKMSLFHLTLR